MLKKIFGVLLAILTISTATAFAYSDVGSERDDYEAITRLSDMGIVSGYPDGTFNPDATITRGEFARLIVSALGKDSEAKSTGYNSTFGDVANGVWSAPYINYVSNKGIVAGYPDGSFQPDKTISFAESLTIVMRVLDYKEDTVGYFWPNNYVNAASSAGVSEGLYYGNDQAITRGDAAVIIDRAMFTDFCGREDNMLLESSGYKAIRDVVVLKSGKEITLSDSGTYKTKSSQQVDVGYFADYAVLDKNSDIVAFKVTGEGKNISKYSKNVYVNAVNENTVSYLSFGEAGTWRFDNTFTIYKDEQKMNFSQTKAYITSGCDLTFYGETYGDWDFAVIADDEVKPVLATKNYAETSTKLESVDINKNGLTVYRDGKSAKLADISVNDVVYYNTKSNVMDVYSKKVTGIYYAASPSKSLVETATVGGKSYKIGYDAAAYKLGANADSFEIGDRVTLLLGKNDEAIFAVELEGTTIGEYGVVLATGTQIAESGDNIGATEIYADIFMTDGEEYRVTTTKDYESLIGSLVKIDYESGKATLTATGTTSGYVGVLDTKNRTLNGKTILRDAVIIQRTAYDDYDYARCIKLDFDTMTAKSITEKQLLNVVAGNGFGDIMILYVKDLESVDSFGIITGIKENGGEVGGASYTIYSNGLEKTYSASFTVSGLANRTPILFNLTGSDTDTLKKLYNIASGKIEAIDESRIKIGGETYSLDADVQVIDISNYSYNTKSIDSLINGDITSVTIYSDTSENDACVIRIIIVG